MGAGRFEFTVNVLKAYQDDKGKMFITAVASDDRLDLQRDRMSEKALGLMANSATKGVPLLETHRSVFEFGKSRSGTIVMNNKEGKAVRQFVVDIELDGEYPQARKLFKEVAGGDCSKQLSVGGKLNLKNKEAVTVEMTGEGLVRTINDIELDHIATTRQGQAANPGTGFLEAITKSLEDDSVSWTQSGFVQKEEAMAQTKAQGLPAGNENQDIAEGLNLLAVVGKAARQARIGKQVEGEPMAEGMDAPVTPMTPTTTPKTPVNGAAKCAKQVPPPVSGTGSGTEMPPEDLTTPEEEKQDMPVAPVEGAEAAPVTPMKETTTTTREVSVAPGGGKIERQETVTTRETPPMANEEVVDTTTPAPEMPEEKGKKRPFVRFKKQEEVPGEPVTPISTGTPKPKTPIPAEDPETLTNEELARDLVSLLSKQDEQDTLTLTSTPKTPEEAEALEAKKSVHDALWTLRYAVAKQVQGAASGEGEKDPVGEVVNAGPFAPRSGAKGTSGLYIPDKAPKGDTTDIGASAISDHRRNIQVGGEQKPTAPTAKEAAAMTTEALRQVAGLPQSLELAQFGKSIEKSIEKSITATGNAVANIKSEVAKSINDLGAIMNDLNGKIAAMESRLSEIENVGGVSHSGPREAAEPRVAKSNQNVWGGMFNKAADKALNRF